MSESNSDPGTKVCPRCAEEVKAAALACRYCGHEFEQAPGGSEPLPPATTASQPVVSTAPAASRDDAAARRRRAVQRNRAIALFIVVWAVVILWAFPTLTHAVGIGGPAATPVPYSQLTPGDQLGRYGECEAQVADAALNGKFPLETNAAQWCLAHVADDPGTWPKP